MKVVLIDDEPIALDILKSLLSKYNDIDIVGCYTNPISALNEIKALKPNAVFLDIEMGRLSGLEVAELLIDKENSIDIVFVTAYSQYAIEAFEINALDYLLKPVSEERLCKTIGRLQQNYKRENKEADNSIDKLYINSFKNFQVFYSQGEPIQWRTRKTKELFAYLWINNGMTVDKTVLLDTVFYDKNFEQATAFLHTTIYQLRNTLRELGCLDAIVYLNGGYQLKVPITSDLDELKEILESDKLNKEEIVRIIKICKGDFLEEGYPWAIELQEYYRSVIIKVLSTFSKISIEKKKFTNTLKLCLDYMYTIEPYDEAIAKLLIMYYGEQNNKMELKNFYKSYKTNLKEEMNIYPSQNTEQLYRRYMS